MNKILKIALPTALSAVILGSLVACSDATAQLNGGNSTVAASAVKSVRPGNFNIYDYHKDVFGFTKEDAYKATYSDGENAFYFSTRQNTTMKNNAYALYGQYHPYSVLAYEEFFYLLESNREQDLGYYAITFAGEWEDGAKDALHTIRDAAAEVVISKTPTTTTAYTKYTQTYLPTIYNFDFKISGGVQVEERVATLGLEKADEYLILFLSFYLLKNK